MGMEYPALRGIDQRSRLYAPGSLLEPQFQVSRQLEGYAAEICAMRGWNAIRCHDGVDQMRKKSSSQQPDHRKKTKMTLAQFSQREMPLMAGAVNFCSNLPMSLYADTTVVKSP